MDYGHALHDQPPLTRPRVPGHSGCNLALHLLFALFRYPVAQNEHSHRLKASSSMKGTLRATLVPYEEGSDNYDEAVGMLDEYAWSYPVSGELRVSAGWNLRRRLENEGLEKLIE